MEKSEQAASVPQSGTEASQRKKILGLEKNVFVLGLTSLLNDFSSEMILSIFPAFFASVLKAGAASLGLVEGLADAASNFIKIYSGRLSDKIQKRKIFVVLGYSLSTLTRPFYILVGTVAGALGLRLADRVGKGLRDAPRDAIVSLSTSKDETGKSFGYQRAMDTIGAILGPLVAFFILSRFPEGFNLVFLVAFFLGLLAVGSLFWIKDITLAFKTSESGFKPARFSRRFKSYLFSAFTLSMGSLPLAVMLLKTRDAGLALATIPLFYSISNIAFAGTSILAGRIADKFGHRKMIIIGYFFLIMTYIVLAAVSTSPAVLVLAFVLYGIFQGATDGIHRSYAAKLTESLSRGRAYGFLNGLNGFGFLIAGVAGGLIWEKISPNVALLFGGILIVIGLISFVLTQIVFKQRFSRV